VKRVCLLLSFVLLLSLVMISCNSETTTKTTTPPSITTKTPDTTTSVKPTTSDKPQYGGTLTRILASDSGIFDPVTQGQLIGPACAWFVNEQWICYDWSKGSFGTGQNDWMNPGTGLDDFMPYLAESYTYPEPGVIVLQVRKGVHYGLNPKFEASRMVNGREMTAEDWVKNIDMFINHPRAYVRIVEPVAAANTIVEQTGPWEVTFTCKKDSLRAWHYLAHGGGYHFLFPPELWQKYPNLQDWRNSVGTGAFMLDDYVANSSITLIKNPGFWNKNPIGAGKGDSLPYVDGVKMLFLPDISSRLAALRTGKVDMLDAVVGDDAVSLKQTTPNLKSAQFLPGGTSVIGMRIDKSELPYKDIKVRQALMLALDFKGIAQVIYGGDAEILAYPINKTFKRAYVPMEQLPADVQELFSYNPEKAKQLLVEAGYPNGFKCTVVCANDTTTVDTMSTFQAMWDDIGVDLTIDLKEFAVYNGISFGKKAEDMIYATCYGIFPVYLNMGNFTGAGIGNQSRINVPFGSEPVIADIYTREQAIVLQDPAGADKIIHDELIPYVLKQTYYIPAPLAYQYQFWWPWVKNYYGASNPLFFQYFWVDQSLKHSMTGR
jgi:peptide/nickel transport system substrate-binding protein